MTGKGHIMFSIASAIFAKRFSLTEIIAQADWWHLIPATMLTSILPDIDHPQSILGQRLFFLSRLISRIFGHRGFTHSLLASVMILIIFKIYIINYLLLPLDVIQGMILGYYSHIIADTLTPAGVPLLWPLKWKFRIPILNNKKYVKLERILCFSLIACSILYPTHLSLIKLDHFQNQLLKTINNSINYFFN